MVVTAQAGLGGEGVKDKMIFISAFLSFCLFCFIIVIFLILYFLN